MHSVGASSCNPCSVLAPALSELGGDQNIEVKMKEFSVPYRPVKKDMMMDNVYAQQVLET